MSAYELRILNESTGQYIPLAFVQGADGKDAFTEAQAKGYAGTEDEFYSVLANAQGALEELMNWSGQHETDSSIHTTEEEKATWDGKAAGTHASQHAANGSDPITPSAIGAAPAYTYGTDDMTAGESTLETGKLYFVYE